MNADEIRGREIMERAIKDKLEQTQNAVARVYTEVPTDTIVRGRAMDFTYGVETPMPDGSTEPPVLEMVAGDGRWSFHRNAQQQLAGRAGIPQAYFDRLLAAEAGGDWQHALLADILTRSYRNMDAKYLVRAIGNEARGFLSDRYRRLDSRPIMEVFLNSAREMGAVPYAGVATDTRVALKAMLPEVYSFPALQGAMRADHSGYSEVEVIAFGLEWSNSDYGEGRNILRLIIFRPWCLNAATMESLLRQVHLGTRLADEIEFSQATYEADTHATVLAVGDATKALLAPAKVQETVERCKVLAAKEADWAGTKRYLAGKLTKDELRRVDDSFNGPDVVNLPPGKSVWRASNALSWLANGIEDGNRRLELERLAGAILTTGKPKEEIQEAA